MLQLMLAGALLLVLLGFAAGRRLGISEGRRLGEREAAIAMRERAYAAGACLVCGRAAADRACETVL